MITGTVFMYDVQFFWLFSLEHTLHCFDLCFVFREQALKKRLALVHDSLNTALSDSSSQRRDNGEQIARLTQAHRYVTSAVLSILLRHCITSCQCSKLYLCSFNCSKALSSYRQIRRKYREQVWKLEQKVAAMTESQRHSGSPKSAGEAGDWRREETILWSDSVFASAPLWLTVLSESVGVVTAVYRY